LGDGVAEGREVGKPRRRKAKRKRRRKKKAAR
jgi:hypothetical protein